ncbi:MAG: hypothetical protein AAFZ65_03870 [Planctomycetota bacterium]
MIPTRLLPLIAITAPLWLFPETLDARPSWASTETEAVEGGRRQGGRRRQGGARTGASEPQRLGERSLADPDARAAGVEGLAELKRELGAAAWIDVDGDRIQVDVWPSMRGFRYQELETTFVPEERGGKMRVHYRTPRLVHVEPNANGYVRQEVVEESANKKQYFASYQRAVVDGQVAWGEAGKHFDRNGADRSRAVVARELSLLSFPLGVSAVPHDVALVREDEQAVVYALRFKRPLQVSDLERATDFVLFCDPETGEPLQWQYQTQVAVERESGVISAADIRELRRMPLDEELRAAVRSQLLEKWRKRRTAEWRAQGNTGEPPAFDPPAEGAIHIPTEVVLPARMLMSNDPEVQVREFRIEVREHLPLPEGALDRPWVTQEVWAEADRANFWDPEDAEVITGGVRRSGENSDAPAPREQR